MSKKLIEMLNKSVFKYTDLLARLSMFIVFFWFGILKVLGESPAEELVTRLHSLTIPFIPITSFLLILGLIEVSIGILFLIPKFTKLAFFIFILQMFTTFLPLLLLQDINWKGFLIPTLTGQYIIKNVVLVALGITILKNNYDSKGK